MGGGTEVRFAEDIGKRAVAALNVRELGTTVIIDREGRIVYRDGGATAYETLQLEVQKVL